MANLVFYMDYGPLLIRVLKSSFIIYTYLDKFKNDNNIAQITYNELYDHLGLASSTVQRSLALLKKLQLLEETEGSVKRYKLLPIKPLPNELRDEILKEHKIDFYRENTQFRKKYLYDEIPIEFQQLLNKKTLQQAYKQIGTLSKAKELCSFFKLDYNIFRLLYEKEGSGSFKEQFKKLASEIENKNQSKSKFSEDERTLASYLYDKLSERGVKPIYKNWFMKNCNIAKTLLSSISLQDAKNILDWGFEDNWWCDKITDLSAINTLHSRFHLQTKLTKDEEKLSRSSPLPEGIQSLLKQQVSTINIKTYGEAYLLKQSVLDGQKREDITKAVDILEKHGILPVGKDNLKFG